MNTELNRKSRRAATFAALADPARLTITDLLVWGDRAPSELQSELGISSSLLSHHLKVLESAGIVVRSRSEGDARRSYVRLALGALDDLIPGTSVKVARVLFVCTANSARSQLAAALWRNASTIPAESAGTHPAIKIDPRVIALAQREQLTLADAPPRRMNDVVALHDFVVTVCDSAHEELESIVDAHWSVPDPVSRASDDAFDAAFAELQRRVGDLSSRLVES